MPRVFGLVNVPDGIDGSTGEDGQVWTADGAGAGWQDAASGAVFDGCTITPGTFYAGAGWRDVTFAPALGGVALTEGWCLLDVVAAYWTGSVWEIAAPTLLNETAGAMKVLYQSAGHPLIGTRFLVNMAVSPLTLRVYSPSQSDRDFEIFVLMPDGRVATSSVSIPAGGEG